MSIYRQGPSPMGSCPRCRETLIDVPDVKGVRTCERCGGVFADNEASRRVVTTLDRTLLQIGFETMRGKPRAKETGQALTCPECLTAMQKIRIESAACEIDACPAHGSWFDAGELYEVMRAYARSRQSGLHSPNRAPLTPQDILLREIAEQNKPAPPPPARDFLAMVVDAMNDFRKFP